MQGDLISRRAVLDEMGKFPLCFAYGDGVKDCWDVVVKAPAVDAVPVVRCKDCNLFIPYTEAHRKASGFDGDCAFLAGYADCDRECVHEMDFCSKGARMDGDAE